MGVVALAAIAAAAIMVSQSTWARQVELTTDHIQARSVLLAGADWARAILADDRRVSNVDYLGEPWALKLPPLPVENGELLGQIEDQQGKFNLNNVVTQGKINVVQLAHFSNLLATLGLPAELADALADWIDADNQPQPRDGAEDAYYLTLDPPYLAANQPLVDVEELSLVRGFDDNVRARLRPYVSALPTATPVNVNTAPAEVIAAVIDGLDLGGAQLLVAQRDRAYFRSTGDFLRRSAAGSGGERRRHQREQQLLHGDAARDHRRRAGARQGAARARGVRLAGCRLAQISMKSLDREPDAGRVGTYPIQLMP